MIIEINGKYVPPLTIRGFQVTGAWDSIYSKGRLLLSADDFTGPTTIDSSYFFIGADVTITTANTKQTTRVLYFKVLAFNLLQGNEGDLADQLEIILVSPWKFQAVTNDSSHLGAASDIINNINAKNSTFDEFIFESSADPTRRRYQLGIQDWEFIETLRPYLTTQSSPLLLFNSLFGKKLYLQSFETLKNRNNSFTIKDDGEDEEKFIGNFTDVSTTPQLGEFHYNKNKEVLDTYSISKITSDLQLIPLEITTDIRVTSGLTLPSILDKYTQVNKVKYSKWDLSALEQRVVALREKYMHEIEYNASSFIIKNIELNLDLGDKITTRLNKKSTFHDKIVSTEYVIKDIYLSFDADNEENTFTKLVGVPLLNLD